MFLRQVVNQTKDKNCIVKNLYNKNNYKDRENIYRRVIINISRELLTNRKRLYI